MWKNNEIDLAVKMLNEGKNFKEIGDVLGKSQTSVTKKLHRYGLKSNNHPLVGSKYSKINWLLIQEKHNDGYTYHDLVTKCGVSTYAITWAKENGKLVLRNRSEARILSVERSLKKEINKDNYKQLCRFKFNVYHFPTKFDLSLIDEYGWYKAKNRGDNPNGVSRDHMFSIIDGFKNSVDPFIISHPANCELMVHSKNNKKKTKTSITLDVLHKRIAEWGFKLRSG